VAQVNSDVGAPAILITGLKRPAEVLLAVRLLWSSVALGAFSQFLILRHVRFSEDVVYAICDQLVVLAIVALIYYKIWLGRNWARIALLILSVIGLYFYVPMLMRLLVPITAAGLIGVLQFLMQAFAMYLVFTQPGNGWFRAYVTATSEAP
jgi:hypothetical protein